MEFRKRALSAALALAVAAAQMPPAGAAAPVSASISSESIYVDGQPRQISACNIKSSNYFMLRDLAALLRGSAVQFTLSSDPAARTIHITTGEPYQDAGSAPAAPEAGAAEAVPSQWKLTVDGKAVPVSAYAVGGYNFFKLRDLGDAIGFSVGYQAAERRVSISSEPPVFSAEIPACPAVSPSWFDDAVFVGDSVSSWLPYYSGDKGLGNATFLTVTSLGVKNALMPVGAKSVHPSYQGTKMKVEDAVAKCGAKKAYIMLGMNDISYGVDQVSADYLQLLKNIQSAAPGTQLYVQSVIPMISTSKRADGKLNNANITAFNTSVKAFCEQNGWYYLDIAGVYADEYGALRPDACADKDGMGLHVTHSATAQWVDYLRTHVPMV